MDDSILPRSLLLFVLLLCSAFFSACEAAFFSLSSVHLQELRENRGRLGNLINALLEKPRELLITIYIGNELVNIAVSVVVTSIAIKIFGNLGVAIAIGVGTFLLLVFGEVIPKSMSLKFARGYSLFAAYPLNLFSKIVQPVQKVFIQIAEKIISGLGLKFLTQKQSSITDEEFRAMVQMGEGDGVIEPEESEMIHNVMEFVTTTVGEVMTPKADMFTLQEDETWDDVLPKIMENFYSRVPIYDKEGEHIIGILFTKDLNKLKHLPSEKFNLKSILRPVMSVPQSKKIKELLQEFKKLKRHMAIVLDEYGSVCGLATLEDVLEELVGEIDSEMRKEEQPLVELSENHYRLTGAFPLSEFNSHFNSELPETDYDTIGGFVFGLFGRIPRSGEAVTFERFKFRVEKMKGARILNLQLTVLNDDVRAQNGAGSRKANTL